MSDNSEPTSRHGAHVPQPSSTTSQVDRTTEEALRTARELRNATHTAHAAAGKTVDVNAS